MATALQVRLIGKKRQRLARHCTTLALDMLAYHHQTLRCLTAMGQLTQLRDFQTHLHLLPFALIHDGLLQRLCQARADDVADFLGFEQTHYGFVAEAAVGAKQAYFGLTQVLQSGFNKPFDVVV